MSRTRIPPGAAIAVALFGGTAAAALEWGPETNLSQTPTDSETGLGHGALAITEDGTLHVVWAERDGPDQTYQVRTRRRTGEAWSPAETIVRYLASDPGEPGDDLGAKFPALAAAPGGELHLFWHDYRVGGIDNAEIFTKSRPPGEPWDPSRSADVRLTTTDHPETEGDNGYVPNAVATPDGGVHVLWYDYRWDGWHAEILAKSRPPGGVWDLTPGDSADERVTSDPAHSELVAVAADAAGNVHAAWRSVDAGVHVSYARRDALTGAWSAPEDVDSLAAVQGAPAIAVDALGAAHVVWPDGRDGGRALWTRVRDAAGLWSPETRISRPADAADEPSLASDAGGTLHLAWSDGRVSLFNREIHYRAKAPAAPWDSTGAGDERVSVADGGSSRPTVIAGGGRVSIVWKDDRDGNREIYFRGGEAAGTTVSALGSSASSGWRAEPNPTRGDRIRLVGPTDVAVTRLAVYDATGRLVRRLAERGNATSWNVRDAAGRRVPSGVYFVRPTAAGSTARATRVTVIR